MQRLTSITEQLKTRECKTVIGVLSAVTKANMLKCALIDNAYLGYSDDGDKST